jgi:type II secretory pathway component PulF
MPNFKYRVRDRSGKAIAGTIDAPTLQVAGDRLYQLGYLPIKIEEEGNEVQNSIKKLSICVEPTLTLFLGVVVLFLALAIFLPRWNLASLFR